MWRLCCVDFRRGIMNALIGVGMVVDGLTFVILKTTCFRFCMSLNRMFVFFYNDDHKPFILVYLCFMMQNQREEWFRF
jgi:hypothetical protein